MSSERYSPAAVFLSRLAVLLYCASFIVPGHHFTGKPNGMWFWGSWMFFIGMIFFWVFPVTISWFANGLFWMALAKRSQPEHAQVWSFLAGVLALSFIVMGFGGPVEIAVREMSTCLPFLLWTGSMFLYAFANHLKVHSAPAEKWTMHEADESLSSVVNR